MSEFDAYSETYRDEIEQRPAFGGMDLDRFTEAKADQIVALAAPPARGSRDAHGP